MILAILGQSPNAADQEWLTEILVQIARPILRTPSALLASQEFFNRDPGVWGRVWVAKYTIPPPEKVAPPRAAADPLLQRSAFTVDEAVTLAFERLSMYEDEKGCQTPWFSTGGVEAEWTCYRPNATSWSRPPKAIPQQIYRYAINDLPEGEDSPVMLFAHGGAFCLMDPANHRPAIARLSQQTDCRVLSVRYRLSPQNIFPAALMDMFLTYLALIAPPPGAFHKNVPGARIVLAGDSSGGNLVAALQVLLVKLVQEGATSILNPWCKSGAGEDIKANQQIIRIPDPPTAGLSITSPWLDVTRSLPSTREYADFDFIAPAPMLTEDLVSTSPLFPADVIWPSDPPRTETYCEARVVAHPLVSPLMSPASVLTDFPSTYISVGWEGMSDEGEVFARKIIQAASSVSAHVDPRLDDSRRASASSLPSLELIDAAGFRNRSTVHVFDGYTAQPHTFSFMPFNEAGRLANRRRAQHIKQAVSKARSVPQQSAQVTWTNSKMMETYKLSASQLGMQLGKGRGCGYDRRIPLTDAYVLELIEQGRNFRVQLEAKLVRQAETNNNFHETTAKNWPLALQIPFVITKVAFFVQYEIIAIVSWILVTHLRDISFALFNNLLWYSMQFGMQL